MESDPASQSYSNVTNNVGEHDLDQILVEMSKANEDNRDAAISDHGVEVSKSDDVVLLEEPVCHQPTNWLDIPNELKDMVIKKYILAVVSDRSTRPETKSCGRYSVRYLHLYPGQFAKWAKQENCKLGLLRASMDLRNAATRIINNLVVEKQNEFKKIARPMGCGDPTCCHYWTDEAFEKARILSLQAFCRGKTAWKAWKQGTD